MSFGQGDSRDLTRILHIPCTLSSTKLYFQFLSENEKVKQNISIWFEILLPFYSSSHNSSQATLSSSPFVKQKSFVFIPPTNPFSKSTEKKKTWKGRKRKLGFHLIPCTDLTWGQTYWGIPLQTAEVTGRIILPALWPARLALAKGTAEAEFYQQASKVGKSQACQCQMLSFTIC